jgi:hypothetical protein
MNRYANNPKIFSTDWGFFQARQKKQKKSKETEKSFAVSTELYSEFFLSSWCMFFVLKGLKRVRSKVLSALMADVPEGFRIVEEGQARILFPDNNEVFYNPVQVQVCDVSGL